MLQPLNEDAEMYQIYTQEELLEDFRWSVFIPLLKVNNAREREQHQTLSLISHTLKLVEHSQYMDT